MDQGMQPHSHTMKEPPIVFHNPAGIINSPGFITALGLLILNDHILKYQFPGLITGKLSDFSGLFLVGLLAVSLRRIPSMISLTVLALLFAWWKSPMSTPFINTWNDLALWPLQRVVDFSDLIALVSLPAAHYYWSRHRTIALSKLLRIPLMVVTVFAVTATSLPHYFIKLDVPFSATSTDTLKNDNPHLDEIAFLRGIDEVIRANGFLPDESCEIKHPHHCPYTSSTGEVFLTVEYNAATRIATLTSDSEYKNSHDFSRKSEQLRRTLRDALVQQGYFPLEGGIVLRQAPVAFTRMLITQSPNADPMTSFYEYDFRRLSFKVEDSLKEMGFTTVARPDCGNNAYYGNEQICSQYLASNGGRDGGEAAKTIVSLVGYMRHGQPPIEISIVQFGTNAPFAAPTLARRLQEKLQTAIPELVIHIVTEADGKPLSKP